MKKLLITTSIYVFAITTIFAQAPDKFNYQGVARNNTGNVLVNQNIAIKLSIITGSSSGTVEYSERHVVTTNQFGLFNVIIGEPTSVISGTFAAITWSAGEKFIKVELDPAGGSTYTDMGTSQLVSTPYALVSGSSADNRWTQAGNDISNNNTGNIGIGTTTPGTKLEIDKNSDVVEYPLRLSNDNGVATDLSGSGIEFGRGPAIWGQIAGKQENTGTYSNGQLLFNTRTSDGAGLETKMTILSNGNVGVGTLTPAHKFDLRDGTIRLSNTTDTKNYDLSYDAAGNYFYIDEAGVERHFVIKNGGLIGIGQTNPVADLHIKQSDGLVTVPGTGGINIEHGVVQWRIYNAPGFLRFNHSTNNWATNTPKAYISDIDGSWNQLSDARLKYNIEPINNVLENVKKINVLKYNYKDNSEGTEKVMGVLAQDVQKLFPSIISCGSDADLLGIDYSKFGVIAIKAIQEQQVIIEKLQAEIEALKKTIK